MTKNKTEAIIEYEVTISKTKLEDKIKERISNYDWTSFLQVDNIDYKEFKFENDRIKINRKPTSWTTFGQLDLFIEEKEHGKTNLKFCTEIDIKGESFQLNVLVDVTQSNAPITSDENQILENRMKV